MCGHNVRRNGRVERDDCAVDKLRATFNDALFFTISDSSCAHPDDAWYHIIVCLSQLKETITKKKRTIKIWWRLKKHPSSRSTPLRSCRLHLVYRLWHLWTFIWILVYSSNGHRLIQISSIEFACQCLTEYRCLFYRGHLGEVGQGGGYWRIQTCVLGGGQLMQGPNLGYPQIPFSHRI